MLIVLSPGKGFSGTQAYDDDNHDDDGDGSYTHMWIVQTDTLNE